MPAQRIKVIGRTVAFILRQSVLGINLVEFFHQPVALHLREDRSRRN